MVPLIGYVDWFSARPSERIAVKVSSRLTEADLVRIVHGDANPAGPGLKFEGVAAAFAGTYPSRFQPVIPDRMGLWRPNVEDDYDKDVYNGDLGIVSCIDLMGPRTTNLRLEAISSKAAAVHRKPQRRRSAAALRGTKPIPYLSVGPMTPWAWCAGQISHATTGPTRLARLGRSSPMFASGSPAGSCGVVLTPIPKYDTLQLAACAA